MWISLLVILLLTPNAFCLNSKQTVTIMASQAKPYVYENKPSIRGLDVDIIKNFAKRYNLKIDYIITDQQLKEVFSSEDRFNNFSQSTEFP